MAAMGGRPVLLQRFPDGAGGSSFFQKRVPEARPDWLETTVVSTPNGTTSQALVVADLAHVLWAVNLGCLGFHVWPSKAADPEHADELRIDLDPSPGVAFPMLREAAGEVQGPVRRAGRGGLPKTTGNRGIHVYVRLEPRWTRTRCASAAVAVARELERRRPDLVTAAWWKEERGEPGLHRLQPERPPQDHLRGVVGAGPARGPGVDAVRVGRAGRHPPRRPHHRHRARPGGGDGDPWAAMTDDPQSLEPLLALHRARPGRRPARRPVAARLPEDARRAAPGGAQPGPQGPRR